MTDRCERCEKALELVPPNEPWHEAYWICPDCDSTYVVTSPGAKPWYRPHDLRTVIFRIDELTDELMYLSHLARLYISDIERGVKWAKC